MLYYYFFSVKIFFFNFNYLIDLLCNYCVFLSVRFNFRKRIFKFYIIKKKIGRAFSDALCVLNLDTMSILNISVTQYKRLKPFTSSGIILNQLESFGII